MKIGDLLKEMCAPIAVIADEHRQRMGILCHAMSFSRLSEPVRRKCALRYSTNTGTGRAAGTSN